MAENNAMPITEIESNEVKRTRSGRVSLPRLAFWAGERVFTSLNDGDASVYIPPKKQAEKMEVPYLTPTGFQFSVNQNVRSLPAKMEKDSGRATRLRRSAPVKRVNGPRSEVLNEGKSKKLKSKSFEENHFNDIKKKPLTETRVIQSKNKLFDKNHSNNENVNPQENYRKSMERTPLVKKVYPNSILLTSHSEKKKNVSWSNTKSAFSSTPRNKMFLTAVKNARKLRSLKKTIFKDNDSSLKQNSSFNDNYSTEFNSDNSKSDSSKNLTSAAGKLHNRNNKNLVQKRKKLKTQRMEISPMRAGLSKDLENLALIDEDLAKKNTCVNLSNNSKKSRSSSNLSLNSSCQHSNNTKTTYKVIAHNESIDLIPKNGFLSENDNTSKNSSKFDVSMDLFPTDNSDLEDNQVKKKTQSVSDDCDNLGFDLINDLTDSEEDDIFNDCSGVFPHDQSKITENNEVKANVTPGVNSRHPKSNSNSGVSQQLENERTNTSGRITRSQSKKTNNNLSIENLDDSKLSEENISSNSIARKSKRNKANESSPLQSQNFNKNLENCSYEDNNSQSNFSERKNSNTLHSCNVSVKETNVKNSSLERDNESYPLNHHYPKRKITKPVYYLNESDGNYDAQDSSSEDDVISQSSHCFKKESIKNKRRKKPVKENNKFQDAIFKNDNKSNSNFNHSSKANNNEQIIAESNIVALTNSETISKKILNVNKSKQTANSLEQFVGEPSSPNLNDIENNSDYPEKDILIIDLFPKTFRNRSASEGDSLQKLDENRESISQNKNQPFRKPENLSKNVTQCFIADLFKRPHNFTGRRQTVSDIPQHAPESNAFRNNIHKTKQSRSCAVVGRFTYPQPLPTSRTIHNQKATFKAGEQKKPPVRKKSFRVSQRDILKNKKLLTAKLDHLHQVHNDDIYEAGKISNLPAMLMDNTIMTVDNSEISLNFTTPRPKYSPAPAHRKRADSSSSESDVSYVEFNTNRKIADLYLHQREKRNKSKQAKDGTAHPKDALEMIVEEEKAAVPACKPLSRADIDKAKDTITSMIKKLAMKEPVVETTNISDNELDDYYFGNEDE